MKDHSSDDSVIVGKWSRATGEEHLSVFSPEMLFIRPVYAYTCKFFKIVENSPATTAISPLNTVLFVFE